MAAPERVRAVQDLRRSHAAGPHGTRPTRAAELAAALADYDDAPSAGGKSLPPAGPEAA